MTNSLSINMIEKRYSNAEIRRIQEQYLHEIRPLKYTLAKIIQLSIPSITILSGDKTTIKYEYDNKTQEQIDILKKHIQDITDNYKKRYPELFKFTD